MHTVWTRQGYNEDCVTEGLYLTVPAKDKALRVFFQTASFPQKVKFKKNNNKILQCVVAKFRLGLIVEVRNLIKK